VKDTKKEKEVGRPKKETIGFENKKTIGFQNKKPNNNENDNENVNVNENVNDNNNASDSCIDGLQKVIDFYNENIGAITPYGLEILQSYAEEMPVDLIIYAMQISVEANKRTIQYIKAILNNWQKAGVKTIADAKNESQKKTNKSKKESNFEQREYEDLSYLYANKGE
jgi:DnaD/phage-associated family protein